MKKMGLLLLAVTIIFTGCTAAPVVPTATPMPTSTPMPTLSPTPAFGLPEGKVIFEKSGKKFAGTVTGQGEIAIILANMEGGGGETQWSPFVEAVDKGSFTTVTFNYLDSHQATVAAQDTRVVFKKLTESGFERIICIGAEVGVGSCMSLSKEQEIVGLVLVGGPTNGSLVKAAYPKLFISGALDRSLAATKRTFDKAGDPKTLVVFEGNSSQGSDFFYSDDRDEFLTLLLDFVNGLASP